MLATLPDAKVSTIAYLNNIRYISADDKFKNTNVVVRLPCKAMMEGASAILNRTLPFDNHVLAFSEACSVFLLINAPKE